MASSGEHNYDKLLEALENQELDAPNGVPATVVYEKIMAIYLLKNEIVLAKLLWKRIPEEVKQQSSDLTHLWGIGGHLFVRNRAAVFQSLAEACWGPEVEPIMQAFANSYRERTVELIAQAYSSIGVDDVSQLLGLNRQEVIRKVELLGWQFDEETQMVLPTGPAKEKPSRMPSEKQLERLTQYVSFLELGL